MATILRAGQSWVRIAAGAKVSVSLVKYAYTGSAAHQPSS